MPSSLLRRAVIATGLASVLTLSVALPAHADPWDGGDIDFGLGEWAPSATPFGIDDVELVMPDTSREFTDLWDGMGSQHITASGLGITDAAVECSVADVEVSHDDATGDLVLECPLFTPEFISANLVVVSQIRVYATSDLIRVSTELSNVGESPITVDEFSVLTDFGNDGQLWGYQGQADSVLAVPAAEDSASRTALADAGAQWAVHFQEHDAPGGIAWGAAGATTGASLTELDGDRYEATVESFTIPAGQSRAVAYFALWNPQKLIELNFSHNDNLSQVAAADALVPLMAEFDAFSGRLTAGLGGLDVVNWGVVPAAPGDAPTPQVLPATGSQPLAVMVVAVGVIALGAIAALLAARRRTAVR